MPIKGWQIVDRAQTLWGAPMSVVYVMGGTNSPTGHRPDCSGYVSMALDLPAPGLDTVTLVTSGNLFPIDWEDVQPGDLIGICGPGTIGANGHVTVVEAVNGDRYTLLEQTPPRGFQRNTYSRNTLEDNGFAPYRYRGAEMLSDADVNRLADAVWNKALGHFKLDANGTAQLVSPDTTAAALLVYMHCATWNASDALTVSDPDRLPAPPLRNTASSSGQVPDHTHDNPQHVTGGVTRPPTP